VDPAAAATWIQCFAPNPRARLRLYCFPYAGGGPWIFRSWGSFLPPDVEVRGVQLPGRGSQLRTAPHTDFVPLLQEIAERFAGEASGRFVFFGHSLGALVAFELARELRRRGLRQPVHLFVSGLGAPQLSPAPVLDPELPDAEFVAGLRELKGTPEEVLDNEELMQLVLPALKADFRICASYRYLHDRPLDCPISSFGGLQDPAATREQVEAWSAQTVGGFSVTMFDGDHFYLDRARMSLLQTMALRLSELC
jgi:medium-chain acyl-[acyl-carrier-protein] hydrolase